jgi:TonB family protein
MKRSLALTLVTLSLFVSQAYSQVAFGEKQFLDARCEPVADSTTATYFRILDNTPTLVARDYYITGELEMEAECSKVTPDLLLDGKATWYYKNGNIKEQGTYFLGNKRGVYKEYYENGKTRSEINYVDNKSRYHQQWSEDGTPLLVNGNGIVKYTLLNGKESFTEVKDSIAITSYTINTATNDTIFNLLEKMPEYPGGYQNLAYDISQNVKYPKRARRYGIEGVVYVSFVIDKEGNVINPTLLRGIDTECDEAAIYAVSKLKRWSPGLVRKKPVLVRFNLPVKFRLRG